MDISGITNLRSFTKLNGMKKTVSANAKNGVIGGASPFFAQPSSFSAGQPGGAASILPQMSKEDSALLSSALTKLKSGQDLSAEELEALKKYDPAAYAEAKEADEREADAYTRELNRCETKEDVRMAHMGKVGEILSELGAAMQRKDLAACMRLMEKLNTLEKAYQAFTASNSFSALAENRQELEAARSSETDTAQPELAEHAPENEPARPAAEADAPTAPDTPDEAAPGRTASKGEDPAEAALPAKPPAKAPGTPRRVAVGAYSAAAGNATAKPAAAAMPHIPAPTGGVPAAPDAVKKEPDQTQK